MEFFLLCEELTESECVGGVQLFNALNGHFPPNMCSHEIISSYLTFIWTVT